MGNKIVIRGAREHNLKNINVVIPRDKLVVITGISGSGKSSLAFDTLYAEGQRRYMESLSSYARQFLGDIQKPDVEYIEGLSPAIAIEQKTSSHNPRSTVGTVTEIYDYLRLLYARIGVPHCPKCGRPVQRQTLDEIIDRIMDTLAGKRCLIHSPISRERKGEYRNVFAKLRSKGYSRVKVDGTIYELDEEIRLDKEKKHTVKLVVDRLKIEEERRERIAESVELALQESHGYVEVEEYETGKIHSFSENFACPVCNISLPEITPKLFSFNSPYGACPNCYGLGYTLHIDPSLVVDENRSLIDGAIRSYSDNSISISIFKSLASHYKFDIYKPFKALSRRVQDIILYGSPDIIHIKLSFFRGDYDSHRRFEGVINQLERRYRETKSDDVRRWIENTFMRSEKCPVCNGKRLRPEVLAVTIGGKNIADFTALNIGEALEFIESLRLTTRQEEIVGEVVREIKKRLSFLEEIGVDYLTLDRMALTLSGGEAQRIRLATQIGARLAGVLYVLDEPTIGLHQRDNKRLIKTLRSLRDLGNTVIIVEHDEQVIRSADHMIDMGPGAGTNGGNIVFSGKPSNIDKAVGRSLTADYLKGIKKIDIKRARRPGNRKKLILRGVRHNNLKNIDVTFPLGKFICITGVSGSGKSSLLMETLYPALMNYLFEHNYSVGEFDGIEGLENVDKVINIDQSPIGRTPRSNPGTYTKVFDEIRELFAMTPEARARGYKKGRFSFNVRGGRCEACQGQGMKRIEMHFLPDVYVECEVCKGKRYNRETLEVKYKGKNIADMLDMTVDEALKFFENIPKINRILQLLHDVGLGYIKIGQPATTLSGGEAQRIKLSAELKKIPTGKTIYLLDEPTTGLHFDDVNKLLDVLQRFVDNGNTVIVIEHNLDVIKNADHIIDLGPEGGDKGGFIVAEGTPEEIAQNPISYTGKYLKYILNGKSILSMEGV
ncbi:MAG: excinuclease ABC subunit UvrA [Thermotogae bacterium]|nr:excinuclease ABC subunit UvrA [Thermotogota bacterium]